MRIPPQALVWGLPPPKVGWARGRSCRTSIEPDGRHYWPSAGPICLEWRQVGQSERFAARVSPVVSPAGGGPANVQKLSPAIFISSRRRLGGGRL
jgi:hypothetical protein